VALQAGLFSAALTAFVIDSKQDLKPSLADEAVYYLRQHSTILSQISVQLSSIAPQVTIPSTPPPPFPPFSPLTSDIRVNVFWFMALAFSLLAALLAILIQQWVRKYMHVFQRYGDPLKSSRLRQYLYEGCEGWYMPKVAEAVPGFLHVSLFLFFAGLGDSLLISTQKSALSAIVPIGVSSLLYIFTTICAHHISAIALPEFIFRHVLVSCSRSHVAEIQGSWTRWRNEICEHEHGTGTDATCDGREGGRKDRDERAIRWLIDNLTEDAEMEKFVISYTRLV
jgi:hypothetical protein